MIPPRLAAFASRIGLTGLAIAILAALLAVQTVRLEGLSVWPIKVEGWKPRAERLADDLDNVKAAQEIALERALAEKHKAETKYLKLAGRIDNEAHNARVDALADAERFIAANRVHCEAAGSAARGTVAAVAGNGSSVHQGAGTLPLVDAVAVPAEDVRICTENTVKALAARDWALGLESASAP
jgi:hypothetical protein